MTGSEAPSAPSAPRHAPDAVLLGFARALDELGASDLDLDTAAASLGVAVKYREDAERVRAALDRILAR